MSQLVMTLPLCVPHRNRHCFSMANMDETAAIRSNQVNVVQRQLHQEGPRFDHISDPLFSHPVGGERSLLNELQRREWGARSSRDESCTGITHT